MHGKARYWYQYFGQQREQLLSSHRRSNLVFYAKCLTVMPRGIHVKSAMGILLIAFRWWAGHGLRLASGNKIAFHNFWYSCDNDSGKGKYPVQPCLNYEGNCLWSVLLVMGVGSVICRVVDADRRRRIYGSICGGWGRWCG